MVQPAVQGLTAGNLNFLQWVILGWCKNCIL